MQGLTRDVRSPLRNPAYCLRRAVGLRLEGVQISDPGVLANSQCDGSTWKFPKIRATFSESPQNKIILFLGLYCVP